MLIGVRVYAARLTQNEEDQLFLAESSNHARSEQDSIATKVGKVEPVKKITWVLVGVMTLLVLVYYVFDIIKQFQK